MARKKLTDEGISILREILRADQRGGWCVIHDPEWQRGAKLLVKSGLAFQVSALGEVYTISDAGRRALAPPAPVSP